MICAAATNLRAGAPRRRAAGASAILACMILAAAAPAATGLDIQWKPTWEQTYSVNTRLLQGKVWKETEDAEERNRRLRTRQIQLIEAMIQRFGKSDEQQRFEGRMLIFKHMEGLDRAREANDRRRGMLEEYPGRPALAAKLLQAILDVPGPEEPDRWIEYATNRLIALNQSAALPDAHDAVVRALRTRTELRLRQGRLAEAEDDLRTLRGFQADDPWAEAHRAYLLLKAGRVRDAHRRFEDHPSVRVLRNSARGYANQLESHFTHDFGPAFDRRLALESKWDMIGDRTLHGQPHFADGLLAESLMYPGLLELEKDRNSSYWSAMDRYFRRQSAAALKPWRTFQERNYRRMRTDGNWHDAVAAYRRFPYADLALEEVLVQGEEMLRRGETGLALRMFRDVRDKTTRPAARHSAQAGIWMALAQGAAGGDAIQDAFAGIEPGALYPWMGKPTPARTIRDELLAAVKRAPPPPDDEPLAKCPQTLLGDLPIQPAWPASQIDPLFTEVLTNLWYRTGNLISHRGDLLVAGSNLLVCYDGKTLRRKWTQSPRLVPSFPGPSWGWCRVPSPTRPALARGKIFLRWALGPEGQRHRSVAAVDFETGRVLWSTGSDPAWDKFSPTTDPVAADGRVFVLAARDVIQGGLAFLDAVCMDAETGAVLWRTHLGRRKSRVSGSVRGRGDLDLAQYGGAITVHEGEVYCSTVLGFAVRLDARDGLTEWSRTYQRYPQENLVSLTQRHAIPPVVVGDRVLFTPRDASGIFALDRNTGRDAWDNPAVPSGTAAKLVGKRLITADTQSVAALDPATGQTRWIRRVGDIRGRLALREKSIVVASPEGLRRLNMADGTVQERVGWSGEPMDAFLLHRGQVVGLSDTSVRKPDPKPLAPGAKPAAGGHLPLARNWRLSRALARVAFPPPEVGAGDRLYVFSEGLVECVALTGGDRLQWRKFLAPDHKILWAPETLVVAWPHRTIAYDAITGAVRWRSRTDYRAPHRFRRGPLVILADLDRGERLVTALDVRTGRKLWRRSLGAEARHTDAVLRDVGWDGKNLHFFRGVGGPGKQGLDIVVRAADGQTIARRPIPRPTALRGGFSGAGLDAGTLAYVAGGKTVHTYRFGQEGGRARALGPLVGREIQEVKMDIVGPWIRLRNPRYTGPEYPYRYFRVGDPSYLLTTVHPGEIRGDRLYEKNGRTLTVHDLPTKKRVAQYTVPMMIAESRTNPEVLSFAERDGRMLVVSRYLPTRWDQQRHGHYMTKLRVDAYDPGTGRHLAGQELRTPHIAANNYRPSGPATQLLWHKDALIATGPHGVAAYRPAPAVAEMAQPVHMVYRRQGPVRIDGLLDDWAEGTKLPIQSTPGADASFRAAHDGRNLLLAADYIDPDARPRRGKYDYGGGDYLELGLRGDYGQYRILVGPGAGGEAVVRNIPYRRVVPLDLAGVRAAIRHDLRSGRMTYELSVPFRAYKGIQARMHRMEMSAIAWDEQPGAGPAEVIRFGRGLIGRDTLTDIHERLHLTQRTYSEEEACLDICTEAPGLEESLAYIRQHFRIRAPDMARNRKFYTELLAANAKTPLALRLMTMLDEALRVDVDVDPIETVMGIAKRVGVPEDVRKRYPPLARTVLSLWTYVPGIAGKTIHWPPRIKLRVEPWDGRPGPEGRDHRVFWCAENDLSAVWSDPYEKHAHSREMRPYDQWINLRVPLIWIGMHDRPFHGMGFMTHFGIYATIDRVSLLHGGKETVLIDDKFPGKARGGFKWVTDPVKSGQRAFRSTHPIYNGYFYVPFDQPVTAHIPPGADKKPLFDRDRAVAALRKNIPRLNGSMDGWRFFRALLRIEAADDPQKRIALYRWYLNVNPDSPRVFQTLARLWKEHQDLKTGDPVARMDADITAAKIKPQMAYDFRSDHMYYGRMFLKNWLVIGPFADTGYRQQTIQPAERATVDVHRVYQGLNGQVHWQQHAGKSDRVSFHPSLGRPNRASGYAICWVRAKEPTPAVLEFGMAANTHVWSEGKLWLDREEILTIPQGRWPGPGMIRKKIRLEAGWNELLVKICKSGQGDTWAFWLELVAADGRGMPKDIEISTTPPKTDTPSATGLFGER